MYKNLTGGESVHLTDFPIADKSRINESLNAEMELVRDVISEGLKLRARTQLKVRQPLSQLKVESGKWKVSQEMEEIVQEELNVKEVTVVENIVGEQKNIGEINGIKIELNIEVTEELKLEGQAREIIRHIQQLRKKAGYNIDDRIVVGIEGMTDVVIEQGSLIVHEVLADSIDNAKLAEHDMMETCDIDGQSIIVTLKK
jgi:isoleucyl-tRNA synthetase